MQIYLSFMYICTYSIYLIYIYIHAYIYDTDTEKERDTHKHARQQRQIQRQRDRLTDGRRMDSQPPSQPRDPVTYITI